MKTALYYIGLALVALTYFCSCESKHTNNIAPVDISELVSDYKKVGSNIDFEDSLQYERYKESFRDSIASPSGNYQGLCCLTKWCITLKPNSEDNDTIKNLLRLYNYNALANCVLADFDVWMRAFRTDNMPMVARDSISSAIKNVDVSAIEGYVQQKESKLLCNRFSWLIDHANDWSDTDNPEVVYNRFDSLVTRNVVKQFTDTVKLNSYFTETDAMYTKYSDDWNTIEKEAESKRLGLLLQKVANAKSFDEQCGIVIANSSKSIMLSMFWTEKLMSTLLSSGKYSPLLWRLWVIWRGVAQMEYGGMSKDSYILNYAYDKLRQKNFETCIAYLREHTHDGNAIATAYLLENNPRIIREGIFPYGNDAVIDLVKFCPGYYEPEGDTIMADQNI